MSHLPPEYQMTDEDLLEAVEDMYPRYLAYVKIEEGKRDLAIASSLSPATVAAYEDELRSYRRVVAQQYRLMELLNHAIGGTGNPPQGADTTDEAIANRPKAAPVEDADGLDPFGFDE